MNSRPIVLCVPYHNLGAHFLTWSMKYLSGMVDLEPKDLGQRINWHHHGRASTQGSVALHSIITQALADQTGDVICFEPINLRQSVHDLFGCTIEQADPDQINWALEHAQQDYQQGISHCQDHDLIPVLFDYCSADLTSMQYNDRYIVDWNGQPVDSMDELLMMNAKTFFTDAVDQFADTVWDRRELLALTLIGRRPFAAGGLLSLVDQTRAHLYYNTDDVWNGFDRCVSEIFHVLGQPWLSTRFDVWIDIYQRWRTVHDPYFARHLPRIIHSIVQGKFMSLHRFRMDMIKEVIIQHELLFAHNLSIRNHGLETFPDNTLQLHQLLEPNHHVLERSTS